MEETFFKGNVLYWKCFVRKRFVGKHFVQETFSGETFCKCSADKSVVTGRLSYSEPINCGIGSRH